MPTLQVIIASTRPGRVGPIVGDWFLALARQHGGFDVQVSDLAELALPLMDEPHHPRLKQYQHEHTRNWSARVDAADAFVFVMPEYNYTFTAPLKNAIDYLHTEWAYKPVGFVSYGGISGACVRCSRSRRSSRHSTCSRCRPRSRSRSWPTRSSTGSSSPASWPSAPVRRCSTSCCA